MILGIGIDIIEIKRIKKIINKYGIRFKNKCFHKNEILRSENKFNSVESYAKRYAAKEACAKALGTGLARGVHWKDIEIYNNKFGKPHIKLHNKAKKYQLPIIALGLGEKEDDLELFNAEKFAEAFTQVS